MWQIQRFVEITDNEGLEKALRESRVYFKDILHELKKKLLLRTACDIRQNLPQTTKLPHPVGIVVGVKTEIGENVKIYQNVTLGSDVGSGEQPKIADDVIIGSGAVVLGEIFIGEGAIIGANSVVKSDVPPQSVAVGAPAKIIP